MIAEPLSVSSSPEKTGYTIERLTADNLADVTTLYAAIHSKPHTSNFFRDKYDTAYTGTPYIGFIAYNKHHLPIAYYGVIPCFIKYGDRLVLAAQSADAMTHPKYRYKGLFVQLAGMTIELCCQSGIKLIYALPNQVALHGFLIKLQWQLTETMNHFIIPVKFIPFQKFFPKFNFTTKLYGSYKHRVLKKYLQPQPGIPNLLLHEGYAGIYRDEDHLQHKTLNKTYVVKIKGALVWIKIGSKLIIGDINCTEDDFDEVISTLRSIARKLGLSAIEFHTSHATKMCDLFAQKYRTKLSLHILFKDLGSGIPLDKIKFTYADAEVF